MVVLVGVSGGGRERVVVLVGIVVRCCSVMVGGAGVSDGFVGVGGVGGVGGGGSGGSIFRRLLSPV